MRNLVPRRFRTSGRMLFGKWMHLWVVEKFGTSFCGNREAFAKAFALPHCTGPFAPLRVTLPPIGKVSASVPMPIPRPIRAHNLYRKRLRTYLRTHCIIDKRSERTYDHTRERIHRNAGYSVGSEKRRDGPIPGFETSIFSTAHPPLH